jgi:hypothetical protein
MAFSQMDVVASLGALLRWSRFVLALHCLWLWGGAKGKQALCSSAPIVTANKAAR